MQWIIHLICIEVSQNLIHLFAINNLKVEILEVLSMIKRIAGAIVGGIIGYLMAVCAPIDAEPIVCIIIGSIVGFIIPIITIIGAVFLFLIGMGFGKDRRRY